MSTKTLNATPEKRIFLSIISEYDLKRSLCELIDNAIDLWTKKKRVDLIVKITLDGSQQTISIEDNSGGIEESKLDHIVSPGKTSNDIHDDVIGYFGVGSKRAVVALAEDIAIHSRFENEKSFTVKFGEHWISQDPDWHLPYSESQIQLNPFTTLIELSKLRIHITNEEIEAVKIHLSEVYSKFLNRGASIEVNTQKLSPTNFDNQWSYPPDYFPTSFNAQIAIGDRKVEIEILSGLIDHPGDPDNSYGIFIYCNNRLITRGLTDFSVGFSSGLIGNPHYNISLVRTIVNIKGQSGDMPWDSSKSGINSKHLVFQAIRQSIIDATKRFAQVSRSLQGKWDVEVFPFKTGHTITELLDTITTIPKSYLPTPPASKQKWNQKVLVANSVILKLKPWTTGLLDSIIATDLIYKSSLSQKNRICLILLDSTLEIAYKEYLVNEKGIGLTTFKKIAENRMDVQKEVAKSIAINIKLVNHYYKLRCDLIHQKATANITDAEVEAYRQIVESLLKDMFGLDCN
jgi:Histidine kinase-, DNA gyrase B-, and HSP90-like ATPase